MVAEVYAYMFVCVDADICVRIGIGFMYDMMYINEFVSKALL